MSSEHARAQADAQTSSALREARGRRADLRAVLVELERVAATPAPGRQAAWCEEVHDAVVEVAAAFERHISATEGPGGLFEEVTTAAPRLAGVVQRLGTEHGDIRAALREALDELRQLSHNAAEGVPGEARDLVLHLLDLLVRHRQLGADMVYEAYAVDIGVGD